MGNWFRAHRWWLLVLAWVLFAASLHRPAVGNPPVIFIGVLGLPFVGLGELMLGGSWGLEPLVLIGMICFLLSPLSLLARSQGPVLSFLARISTFGLLLPWGIPAFRTCFPDEFS